MRMASMPDSRLSRESWNKRHCIRREAMTEDAAKTCVRRHFEEMWNQGKAELAGELLTDDFMNFGGAVTTVMAQIIATWRTAFPDLRFSEDSMVVHGELVLCEMTFS